MKSIYDSLKEAKDILNLSDEYLDQVKLMSSPKCDYRTITGHLKKIKCNLAAIPESKLEEQLNKAIDNAISLSEKLH